MEDEEEVGRVGGAGKRAYEVDEKRGELEKGKGWWRGEREGGGGRGDGGGGEGPTALSSP